MGENTLSNRAVGPIKLKHLLLTVMVTMIWGANFSGIKMAIGTVDPFILAGLRFVFCAFPVIFFIPKPDVPLKIVAAYGLAFGVGLWGFVNLGIQLGVSAGVTSLVLQCTAFITVLMGYLFFNETITRYKILGFLLALIGLALILRVTDGSITVIGLFMVVLGAICWSATNVLIKKSGAVRVFSFLVWSSLFSPIPLFLIGYISGGEQAYIDLWQNLDNVVVIGSVLYQAYGATLIGFSIWNYLLSLYPLSSVAPISLLVPVFGFLASAAFFGESVGSIKLVAGVLILSGLLVSLFGDRFMQR